MSPLNSWIPREGPKFWDGGSITLVPWRCGTSLHTLVCLMVLVVHLLSSRETNCPIAVNQLKLKTYKLLRPF